MNAHSYDFALHRESPNNIEAEQALLGALFANNDLVGSLEFLRPSHFFEPLHRRIYDTCIELIKLGKTANPVTVKSFLPADEKVGGMTVAQYLARLAAEAVTVINAVDYARAIEDMSRRRRLIVAADHLREVAFDAPAEADPQSLGDMAIDEISAACETDAETLGAISMGDAITSAIDMANAAFMKVGKRAAGFGYRVWPLERLIGPLFGGQLIIIGGATKQGKSGLVGQMSIGAALEGYPVDFYSGEMTAQELAMREISRRIGVPVRRQKRGELTEAQFAQMVEVHQALKDTPILIQNRRLTLPQLKDRWRRIVRKRGKSLLILDHAGLLDRDRATAKMSNWEFGEEVTRELKATARDLDCPIVVCVLNDSIRRKPRYSDLLGAVERDADHVIMPFRPEVFLMENEPTPGSELYGVWECKVAEWRGRAQFVLALSRELPWPANVTVGWDGGTTSFFEIGENGFPERFDTPVSSDPMRLF